MVYTLLFSFFFTDSGMKKKTTLLAIILAFAAPCFLVGCDDGKVTEEAARAAGETLKKWQDQNK
jgi:hypothetical protein